MWKKRCEIEIVCQFCLFCMERKQLTMSQGGVNPYYCKTLDYKSFIIFNKINNFITLKAALKKNLHSLETTK